MPLPSNEAEPKLGVDATAVHPVGYAPLLELMAWFANLEAGIVAVVLVNVDNVNGVVVKL